MKFEQEVIPVALAAFNRLEFCKEAWDCLEDKGNWLPEPGTDIEESIYQATFELRWGDDIDAALYERIVRMLEPFASEHPNWLGDAGESELVHELSGQEEGENKMRRGKRPDPTVAWKLSQKAILALRKTVIVAGREGWISAEECSALNTRLFEMERVLMAALVQPTPDSESEAMLPF